MPQIAITAFNLTIRCWKIATVSLFVIIAFQFIHQFVATTNHLNRLAYFSGIAILLVKTYLTMGYWDYLMKTHKNADASILMSLQAANKMFFQGLIGQILSIPASFIAILFRSPIRTIVLFIVLLLAIPIISMVPFVLFILLMMSFGWTMISLWIPIMFRNEITAIKAMKLSYYITKGNFKRTFFLVGLPFTILFLPSFISAFINIPVIYAWMFAVLQIIATLFIYSIAFLVYISLDVPFKITENLQN